jgi:hypothetical protein
MDVPAGSALVLPHNATLDGVHQARCDGARLIGLVRKDASVWLEAVAAVAEEERKKDLRPLPGVC